MITSFQLSKALADHLGVPFVDLQTHPPDVLLAALIPEEVARRYCALPVERWSGQIVVAMANPNDVFALDDLRVLTGQSILAALAEPQHLLGAIDRAYPHSDRSRAPSTTRPTTTKPKRPSSARFDLVDEGPIVKFVNALLEKAAADHASDLHIEPATDSVMIRERIDGILHDTSEAPLNVLRPMISRIKVMGSLDIAQNRLPQDGRFSVDHSRAARSTSASRRCRPPPAKRWCCGCSTRRAASIDLASLGLSADESARFVPAFHAPQGAIFVTGPTGSGKSSTLYAVISAISTRDKSIVSVEDPVEYRLDGVKQIQVHMQVGADVPERVAFDPARRPRRDPHRRGARRRDRAHRGRRRDHRPPRALDLAHDARGRGADPPHRHGRRALPRGVGAHVCRRATPRAQAVRPAAPRPIEHDEAREVAPQGLAPPRS